MAISETGSFGGSSGIAQLICPLIVVSDVSSFGGGGRAGWGYTGGVGGLVRRRDKHNAGKTLCIYHPQSFLN